jgi:hypothetical protein
LDETLPIRRDETAPQLEGQLQAWLVGGQETGPRTWSLEKLRFSSSARSLPCRKGSNMSSHRLLHRCGHVAGFEDALLPDLNPQ